MKYPTHPTSGPGPRDVWDISWGMFPEFNRISQGNGVILRVFLYWLVYFTCICHIDEKLVTLRKFILNPRKAPERLGDKDWEDFANKKFWSPQKSRNELGIVYSTPATKPPTQKHHSFLWGWIVPNGRLPDIDVKVCWKMCPQTWKVCPKTWKGVQKLEKCIQKL